MGVYQPKRRVNKSNEIVMKSRRGGGISQDFGFKNKNMTIQKVKVSVDCRSSNSENLNDEDSEMFQSIHTNALMSSPNINDNSTAQSSNVKFNSAVHSMAPRPKMAHNRGLSTTTSGSNPIGSFVQKSNLNLRINQGEPKVDQRQTLNNIYETA